jgi:guanine deaminase
METHEEFMTEAIRMALENIKSGNGGPFGAKVVKDGKISGRGANKVAAANDPTAHAEVNAIRDACKNLGDFQLTSCTIYSSCEPCPMCLGAIYWARPEHVYFAATKSDAAFAGFDDTFIYTEIQKEIDVRHIPFRQIMREKANAVFEEWRNKQDKIEY